MHPEGRRALRLLASALVAGLTASPAQAEDEDRTLRPFARSTAAAARGAPVDVLEWERRTRAPDRLGPTPLRAGDLAMLAAARGGRWTEVQDLVKSGKAAVNARDDRGAHVLVMAARAGQDELVRELLRRGADPDRVGEDGFTALGAAAAAGRRSTVRLLVLAGADPQRWGASGQTALHLAALGGQPEVLAELLRLGTDIEQLNRQRESALDVAANANQQAAMDLLIQGGADLMKAGRR